MRINVLQHASDEGPGAIKTWAHARGHALYVYHPADFGHLPTAAATDFLILLGGPMSPNDQAGWIKQERRLIKQVQAADKPIFGVCFGAQQLALVNGAKVQDAPVKEVGWGPVCRQSERIPGLPPKLTVLHWHEQMFSLPQGAVRLFKGDFLENQGFLLGNKAVGLQFHLEQDLDNLREIVINDGDYALTSNALQQGPADILQHGVPAANAAALFAILDYLVK